MSQHIRTMRPATNSILSSNPWKERRHFENTRWLNCRKPVQMVCYDSRFCSLFEEDLESGFMS